MPLVVPNAAEVRALQYILTPALTIRIFGNNVIPGPISVSATFIEIAGGGYANKPLVFADWLFTPNAPSAAIALKKTWNFTGVINAPGTVYGYYVTRDADGLLMWAELFAAAIIPFVPINGSLIEITPRFTADSVF